MTWTTSPPAGAPLLASTLSALITDVRPIHAAKESSTARTSTAHAADPHLAVTLPAGSWDVEMTLLLTSAANGAGDFSWRLAWTGTASVVISQHGLVDSLASGGSGSIAAFAAASDSSSPTVALAVGCSTTMTMLIARARVVASTSVTLSLEWAQASSSGNATNLLAGSTMTAHKVS